MALLEDRPDLIENEADLYEFLKKIQQESIGSSPDSYANEELSVEEIIALFGGFFNDKTNNH